VDSICGPFLIRFYMSTWASALCPIGVLIPVQAQTLTLFSVLLPSLGAHVASARDPIRGKRASSGGTCVLCRCIGYQVIQMAQRHRGQWFHIETSFRDELYLMSSALVRQLTTSRINLVHSIAYLLDNVLIGAWVAEHAPDTDISMTMPGFRM
jgi:hypothetical protein